MNGEYGRVSGKDIPVDRRFVIANMSTHIIHGVESIQYGTVFTVCGRIFLHPYKYLYKEHPGIGRGFLLCLQCKNKAAHST